MKTLNTLLLVLLISAWQSHAADLIAKYDFESDAKWLPNWGAGLGSKYKPATGWKTPFKVSLDRANPHSGDACLKMEIVEAAEGEKILHTNVIAVGAPAEGKKVNVVISFYIRAQGFAEKSLHLRGMEKDEANRTIGMLGNAKSLVAIPISNEWAEVRWQGKLNPKTRGLMIMLAVTTDSAPAEFWLDDLSVESEVVDASAP